MGHGNVYIRVDNEGKWKALGNNKSKWLNEQLSRLEIEPEPARPGEVKVMPSYNKLLGND